jgi:hypothetical protein
VAAGAVEHERPQPMSIELPRILTEGAQKVGDDAPINLERRFGHPTMAPHPAAETLQQGRELAGRRAHRYRDRLRVKVAEKSPGPGTVVVVSAVRSETTASS